MRTLLTLVLVFCIASDVVTVPIPYIIAAAGSAILQAILKIRDRTNWSVIVENQGRHHAHLWCASKDDRIGGSDGIWVAPGKAIAWKFGKKRNTQFWCTMDWWGQRVGWDVFVGNWGDAPNPTKWAIRNDGVYDQWRSRKWRNLRSSWFSFKSTYLLQITILFKSVFLRIQLFSTNQT